MYTVKCMDINCNWRLLASRLPDGITWAIKKIDNPEHTCRGIDAHNSLVTVEWGANKLIEDIRAK